MKEMSENQEAMLSPKESSFLYSALVAGGCFLLVHLMLVFRHGPFGDEVWDLSGDCWQIYLAGGRYTVTLFRLIFSPCGVPVAYGIAASVFWGLAVAIQMKILRIHIPLHRFVFIAFSVSVIPFTYLMIVAYHADAVALGFCAVSYAYLLYEKGVSEKRKILVCISVVLAAVGAGAYQLLLMLLPCLFLSKLLICRNEEKAILSMAKDGVIFSFWCVIIVAVYFVVSLIGKQMCDTEYIKGVDAYQAGLITLGELDFVTHILHIGKQWCTHLIGCSYAGEWIYATTILPVVVLCRSIWRSSFSVQLRIWYGAAVWCLFCIPFLPIAATGEDLGARLFLSQPLACASLWYMAVCRYMHNSTKICILVLSVFIMLKACYTVSDMAFFQKRLFEQSMALRAEIMARALQVDVPSGVDVNACPILVYKHHNSPLRSVDIYGSCIPAAGDHYLEQYLDTTGIKQVGRDKKLSPIFKQMPVYPAAGSIRYHEGAILVKLAQ